MSDEIEALEGEETGVRSGPKLSPEQWAEIRTAYELGQKRTPQLADEYGISTSAISQHFKRFKVVWGRAAKAAAEAAAKKAETEATGWASKRQERIDQTKEQAWNDSVIARSMMAKMLFESHKAGTSIGNHIDDMKTLRQAEAIIRGIKELRWSILEVDKNVNKEELTELPILDYTEEQLKKIRSGESDELPEDLEVPALEDMGIVSV